MEISLISLTLSLAALACSLWTLHLNRKKEKREAEVFKNSTKIDIGTLISPAKYLAEIDYNRFTGESEEFFQLQIPYQIQNKGSSPIIIDKVYFIFKDPKKGIHIRTFNKDFSSGLIVIESRNFTDFMFPVTFSDGEKIKEVYGLTLSLRIEIRGYLNPYSFKPILLDIED